MFEYINVSGGNAISINPRYIVSIAPEGQNYTHICLANGNSVIVNEKYDIVKQHFANYLPPI